MILERFYDDKLAQASYLVGCAATGEALVTDPNRDAELYLRAAQSNGVRITHITETHMHADFLSGSRELAARTGAALYLSDEGDADWKYAFAEEDGATLLHDGDSFRVGNILVEVVHTPGHTPEHLSFLMTDTAAADQPIGVLTGDFVFAGDVGRPDLLETAAGIEGTMAAGARTLFRSLQQFKQRADYLQIWPGHGAGSACGKGISSIPSSTVGYERLFNWAFAIQDEDEFVQEVLAGQPEPPAYFAEMKRINKIGPRVLGGFNHPPRLAAGEMAALLESGAPVVDTRAAAEYAAGYIPGTINIPLNRSFTTWAGWLLPYDKAFALIVGDERAAEAVRDLAMIGLDRVAGLFDAAVVREWAAAGGELGTVPQITLAALAERMLPGGMDEVEVIDVRGAAEYAAGYIPTGKNIPVGYLEAHLAEIPRDRPVVIHCQSGGRSAIAASLLRSKGLNNVTDLPAGFAGWEAAGHAVARDPGDGAGNS